MTRSARKCRLRMAELSFFKVAGLVILIFSAGYLLRDALGKYLDREEEDDVLADWIEEKNEVDYPTRRDVYEHALDRWGVKAQLQMCIEEMSELTKELCKNFRGAENRDEIAEEIADVTIVLEQARLIFGINDQVCKQMDSKVRRLAEKLGVHIDE